MLLDAGSHSGSSNGRAQSRHRLPPGISIRLSKSQCSIPMATGEVFKAAQNRALRKLPHGKGGAVMHHTTNSAKADYTRRQPPISAHRLQCIAPPPKSTWL